VTWSRRQLSEQVDALAGEHDGEAFVAAVEGFAETLGAEERAVLGEVLVERAGERGDFDYGVIRRVDEPRWKLFGRPPREPGRSRKPGT
jgi:hypothetical protein